MNRRPQILLIEDREEDVYLFRRAMQRAGIDIGLEVASDGASAMDYLAGNGPFGDREKFPWPDLILLDLKLPLQTGLEVLAWIRSQPAGRSLVVIVLSSSLDQNEVGRAYALGANAFLVKPSDVNTLTGMCRAIHDFWLTYNQTAPPPGRAG